MLASNTVSKQLQTITTPPPCLTQFPSMKCFVGFKPDVAGPKPAKKFNFCLILQFFPQSLGDHQEFVLSNVRQAFLFLIVES